MKKSSFSSVNKIRLKRKSKSTKTWDDINIHKIEEDAFIRLRERISNTNLKKGDTLIIDSYAVFHSSQFVAFTFKSRGRKCYDLPYRTFDVI